MTVRAELTLEVPALRTTLSCRTGRIRVIGITGVGSERAAITLEPREVSPMDLLEPLQRDETVRDVELFHGETLLQVHVDRTALAYDALLERRGVVEEATATRHGWHLTVLFPDHQRLQEYWARCCDRGHDGDIGRIGGGDDRSTCLTPAQEEILRLAHANSYYAIPRNVELGDLAADLGISDQAASERLRRGIDGVLAEYFGTHPKTTTTPDQVKPAASNRQARDRQV